jgi:NitT/TauT family transport system ATP-binding protein
MTTPMTTPVEPLCELRNVHKLFKMPNGLELKVLDDINLAVYPQEILCLLGPSGCGKSTIMRILIGLIEKSAGEVLNHGKPLEGLNVNTAIVFQGAALYPWLSVFQNVEEALIAKGLPTAQRTARVKEVLALVGLEGFEDAFPRELSGGMKQRVGIARALAVEPELLCMDEPFSQVDALTAENMRAETIRFWSDREKNPKSILMVSHDIKEVCFMASRIVVLDANPGRIRQIIENTLPYPRDPRSQAFLKLVDRIHDVITETAMPEEPVVEASAVSQAPAVRSTRFEVLPHAGIGEIGGLLEILDDHGGTEDAFQLASDVGREYQEVLNIIKAAELLDLVDTPKRDVTLLPAGKAYLSLAPQQRTEAFRHALLGLNVFRWMLNALEKRQNRFDADIVREELAVQLPFEDNDRLFATMVNWARNADLFDYESDTNQLVRNIGDHAPATVEPKPPEAPSP